MIIQELVVKDSTFNLKSVSTGKYSVHDSYRENYSNGTLLKINAPEDVNHALKDIYYATEKGLIVSYRDFNNKIIHIRTELLTKNFPGKELKLLEKEERLKIERESAKQVLKDLSISETTKLIFSPELSTLKKEYENLNLEIKYEPLEYKVVFSETEEKQKDTDSENDIQKKLVSIFLDFSEQINPIVEKAVKSYNFDELELTIISVDKFFNDLPEFAKENPDINHIYQSGKSRLLSEAELMKERQNSLERSLNKKVDDLLEKKDFTKIKASITEIEKVFEDNFLIKNDSKSRSIKDLAIEKLKNSGKVIALVVIKHWNKKNIEVAEELLKQNLPSELENILHKKLESELTRIKLEEKKLSTIDIKNSSLIFEKFSEISSQKEKEVFLNFFNLLISNGYDNINNILIDYSDTTEFLILLENNLPNQLFKSLWENLSDNVFSKIIQTKFPYYDFKHKDSVNLFTKLLAENASQETTINILNRMNPKYSKSIDVETLGKIIIKLSDSDFDFESFARKLSAKQLLELTKVYDSFEVVTQHIIVRILTRWLTKLEVKSNEFKEILKKFPEEFVIKIKKSQALNMEISDALIVLEALNNNEELSGLFANKIGKEKFDQVLKLKLKTMVYEDPNNSENHLNLGIANINVGDYESAKIELKRSIGINPESPDAHYFLGMAHEKAGEDDLAIVEFKKATQLKYGYIDAFYNLGLLYSRLKEYFLAIQQFKKILKIDPDNYDTYLSLGIAYDEAGEYDEAEKQYLKAMTLNPKKVSPYMNLAAIMTMRGHVDDAIQLYTKTIEFDPENPRIQYNLGILHQQKKEYNMAVAHYKIAIKFDPKNSNIYNNLGLVYFFKTDVPKAVELWKKSVELDDNIDAYNNLGWGYYVMRELDKSIEIYEKAKKINPKHAILSLNLGTVYYRAEEYKKAISELENYMLLEPQSENTYEVMKIVKTLREKI